MALQIARLISNLGADGADISLRAHQPDTQPMVLMSKIVPQKNRLRVVLSHEHVDRAIVVKIAQRQTASGQWL